MSEEATNDLLKRADKALAEAHSLRLQRERLLENARRWGYEAETALRYLRAKIYDPKQTR